MEQHNTMQARQHVKILKVDKNLENAKEVTAKYCDGILNFEPGMTLGAKFVGIYSIQYSNT